jgi:hypothetical protein
MARSKESVSFTVNLSNDQVAAIVAGSPKLQEAVIEEFQRGMSGKSSATRRASSGTRVKRGLHHVMAIKALAAAGAVNKKGAVERAGVMEAGQKLGHDFGSTLSATLDTLAEKGLVSYENISDNNKPRYKWWLIKSEKDALDAIGASDSN